MNKWFVKNKMLLHLLWLLLAVAVLLPLFSVVWPETHDLFRYPFLSYAFDDAFANGVLYPRWLPDFCNGYGYPTFVFYQPGLFYLVLFCRLFTDNLISAYQFSFVLLFYFSFLGVYKLAGEFTRDIPARIFAVLIFLLTPYIYVNLYVRGDLSELSSLLLTPWPLFFLIQAGKHIGSFKTVGYTFITSLTLAMMIFAHPFPCVVYFPFFLVFAVAMVFSPKGRRDFSFLKIAVISLAAAALMSAPYWLNAFLMKSSVFADRAMSGYFLPENHLVYPFQLFSNYWDFGISTPGIKDTLPFQLGLMHFIIATAGTVLAYKNKKILFTYISYLVLILMMTPAAALVWKYFPVLPILQFPWRLLSVIAIMQMICCLGLSEMKLKKRYLYLIFGGLIAISAFWYRKEFSVRPISDEQIKRFPQYTEYASRHFITATSSNEFMPVTAKKMLARGDAPLLQTSRQDCRVTAEKNNSKYHLRYSVSVEKPLIIRINQYYFPGWRVLINNRRVDDDLLIKNLSAAGLIQLQLNAGADQTVEAYYDGPVGWRLINGMALIPLLVFMLLLLKHKRSQKTEITASAS